jgi:hypothetical protein
VSKTHKDLRRIELPAPLLLPTERKDAHRDCWGKKRHRSERIATRVADDQQYRQHDWQHGYLCDKCGFYHTGHLTHASRPLDHN